MNAATLKRIIELLAAAVAPLLASRHIILSMDACPVHLVPSVLRSVSDGGMYFLLIAAKMTKWMQPCDVAVFGPLKHRLRQVFGEGQIRARMAELSPQVVLGMIASAVEEVVSNRDWSPAFRRCGLQGGWPTSTRFLQALGPLAARPLTSEPPTLAQLQNLFPRGRYIPIDAIFAPFLRPRNRAEPLAGRPRRPFLPVAAGAAAPASEAPWRGRTRSTAHLAVTSADTEAPVGSGSQGSLAPSVDRPRARFPTARRLLVQWPAAMPRSPSP